MTAPLYSPLDAALIPGRAGSPPPACDLGLWYTRFFDHYASATGWSLSDGAKRSWCEGAAAYRRVGPLEATLEATAHRRYALVRALGGDLAELRTCWHFVTGLGLPHPVENGFAWHPTLGLPYLPAAGVKGLLGAWLWTLEEDDGQPEGIRAEAERRRRDWCGVRDDAGSLIFFDALPTEPPVLAADVMTPHMGQWYAEGGSVSDPDREPQRMPADWHSPVPVPFLVVDRGTFLFGIAPRPGADGSERSAATEVAAALKALEEALAVLGAGAKTAVGYGRFTPGGSFLRGRREAEAEAARAEAQAERRAAQLAHFDGFDPPVGEVLGDADLAALATHLLAAMEGGTWSPESCRRLAARLRDWLVERGEWVEHARGKAGKASKNRRIRRTLEVLKWLEG